MMQQVPATQLLRDDHKRVKGLALQLQTVGQRAPEMKAGVARQILMELEIHSELEKGVFYPACETGLEMIPACNALLETSFQEHAEVEAQVARLKSMSVDDPAFDVLFAELMADVDGHVLEEEKHLFPMAERVMSGELILLGMRMSALRTELLAQDRFRDAQPQTTQDPNGGEQMRKSAA